MRTIAFATIFLLNACAEPASIRKAQPDSATSSDDTQTKPAEEQSIGVPGPDDEMKASMLLAGLLGEDEELDVLDLPAMPPEGFQRLIRHAIFIAFGMADKDKNKYLSREEFLVLAAQIRPKAPEEKVLAIFTRIAGNDDSIGLGEFMTFVKDYITRKVKRGPHNDPGNSALFASLKKEYQKYDTNGDRKVSPEEHNAFMEQRKKQKSALAEKRRAGIANLCENYLTSDDNAVSSADLRTSLDALCKTDVPQEDSTEET